MCGILGYVGNRPVTQVLMSGLKKLEYRGYDSAGVAYYHDGEIRIQKAEGKLANVEKLLAANGAQGSRFGLGHTRWATHGRPTEQNAHPHRTGHVVLVHNGIIENFEEIRQKMIQKGYQPQSETDSELFGFLVLEEMKDGVSLEEGVRRSFNQVKGACSVVVLSEKEPGKIVGVRDGSPLAVARDPKGGAILASDAQPILEYTQEVAFLEDGDLVTIEEDQISFFDLKTGKKIQRDYVTLDWTAEKMDKQGHPHYMLKEIYEQPQALVDTFNSVLERKDSEPFALVEQPGLKILQEAKRLVFVACGTSWHSALLGQYWIERKGGIPVSVELSSEFRYRRPILEPGTVVVGISQSGETADTLAVVREMKKRKILTLGITNTRGSTLSREADATFFTAAGPEIGVAATKTFTANNIMLFLWSNFLAKKGGVVGKDPDQKDQRESKVWSDAVKLPHLLTQELSDSSKVLREIQSIAQELYNKKGFFFIGRGYCYPLALEGALKLKEIAYIHAEGYAAGELKHGPIAMIDHEMVVVVLAPDDLWHSKTISNLQEVKARGAIVVGVGNSGDEILRKSSDYWIPIPSLRVSLNPFLLSPVIQLLSYHIAVLRGTDVDQPRNLAKSVTVE